MIAVKQRNEPAKNLRNLSPIDAITATLVIEGTVCAFLDTAPTVAEELYAAEPFERRMSLGSHGLSPYVRFTTEEWQRMSLEHIGRHSRYGTAESVPKPRTDEARLAGASAPPSPRGRGFTGGVSR